MKKIFLIFSFVFLSLNVAFAGPFDKFNDVLNSASNRDAQKYLDNLANDLGALMTGGSFGVSASLGFARLKLNAKLTNTNVSNEIMDAEGTSVLYMPVFQAEFGLPYDLDIIGRYAYSYDSNLYGLGARYLVYDSSIIVVPSVSVQGIYSIFKTSSGENKLDTDNIALGAVATFNIPIVTPYVAIGFDKTNLKPQSSNKQNLSGSSSSMGYSAGVAVSFAMINGNAGITIYDGRPNYSFGLSAGF